MTTSLVVMLQPIFVVASAAVRSFLGQIVSWKASRRTPGGGPRYAFISAGERGDKSLVLELVGNASFCDRAGPQFVHASYIALQVAQELSAVIVQHLACDGLLHATHYLTLICFAGHVLLIARRERLFHSLAPPEGWSYATVPQSWTVVYLSIGKGDSSSES